MPHLVPPHHLMQRRVAGAEALQWFSLREAKVGIAELDRLERQLVSLSMLKRTSRSRLATAAMFNLVFPSIARVQLALCLV
jgi:hypothetical protein